MTEAISLLESALCVSWGVLSWPLIRIGIKTSEITSKSVDGTANAKRSTVENCRSSAKSHHVSPGLGFWYGNKNLPGSHESVKQKGPRARVKISPVNLAKPLAPACCGL